MAIGTQWNVEDIDALVAACKAAIARAPEMTTELERIKQACEPFAAPASRPSGIPWADS